MDNSRKTAIIVGVLFIIATAFLFIGRAVYEPVLYAADYLQTAYQNRTIAIVGMLLEFACVLAIPLIPVFLYPILRKHNEALALGYFGFRFFEAILFVLVQITTLSLISVSQAYLNSDGANPAYFEGLGTLLAAWNQWAFIFYVFIFSIGAMLLYTALYQSKLVPRFLSIWGLIAAVMLLVGTAMEVLGLLGGIPAGVRELIYAAPIAVNEMVLALWLIIKGFNPEAIAAAEKEEPDTAAQPRQGLAV